MSTTSDLDKRHVWHPFTQAKTALPPIPINRASGAKLYAEDGREFIDLVSSWWVNLHGHAHPDIANAVAKQAQTLEQVIFADFTHAPAAGLAEKITSILPGDLNRVFFSDDGSTAVEVSLKLAHQYWRNKGEIRKKFIAFDGGYHGDTVGAMSTGAASGFFDAFKPMLFPVDFAPYPETWEGDTDVEQKERSSLNAIEKILTDNPGDIAAIIIEPLIQGAGGMRMCRPEFLQALQALAKEKNVLVIYDEVMTGFGRTGDLFACRKARTQPDLICLSKGLTGGFMALSLTVARDDLYDAFWDDSLDKAFLHGHSFTANPLGCAAGLASFDLLTADSCQQRIRGIEALHRSRMLPLNAHPKAHKARVMGTIAALDIKTDDSGYGAGIGPFLKKSFMDRGLLIRPLGNVVYLLPPYCIEDDELNRAYDVIEEVLHKI